MNGISIKKGSITNSMKKIITLVVLICNALITYAQQEVVLLADNYKSLVEQFNRNDHEVYKDAVPNVEAWQFLKSNIPLLDCPDKNLELTYYFRWWTLRKHIRKTPDGYIFTEFLPDVSWAGKYNSINCAAAQHYYEARWLWDDKYLKDYSIFWLRKGGSLRSYSFWMADAVWSLYKVRRDQKFTTNLIPDLVSNYYAWEKGWTDKNGFFTGKNRDGLFSQIDDRDGMEMSIGGNGKRPTINAYMYGDARAISSIAGLNNDMKNSALFTRKADTLRKLVTEKLWDKKSQFFQTLKSNKAEFVNVREVLGYTPWFFELPPTNKGYEIAWSQIKMSDGFNAPYGLTTAEQRHPKFQLSYVGHECKWDGPSWPFSTSITLSALANVLNDYRQDVVTKSDYFQQLLIYANAHRITMEDGKILPWIDEVINPYTGDWISRTMLKDMGWQKNLGGLERGKDYNHSTFCDLIISGLVGIRPQADDSLIINPLLPDKAWDWFCLDRVPYHGHSITVLYDRYGKKYGKGKGLMCFSDGKLIASSEKLEKLSFKLK